MPIPDMLTALAQVLAIDLVLAGDNAIVIGLAAAGLPDAQRTRAVVFGIAAATALRVVFAVAATQLLQIVGFEADLIDQLFNSSEKRLARALLLMADFGKEGEPERVIPKINQETLAEMVGTTRSRVSFFMNRFRKLGFVKYNGDLRIHNSLLNVLLDEKPHTGTVTKRRNNKPARLARPVSRTLT